MSEPDSSDSGPSKRSFDFRSALFGALLILGSNLVVETWKDHAARQAEERKQEADRSTEKRKQDDDRQALLLQRSDEAFAKLVESITLAGYQQSNYLFTLIGGHANVADFREYSAAMKGIRPLLASSHISLARLDPQKYVAMGELVRDTITVDTFLESSLEHFRSDPASAHRNFSILSQRVALGRSILGLELKNVVEGKQLHEGIRQVPTYGDMEKIIEQEQFEREQKFTEMRKR